MSTVRVSLGERSYDIDIREGNLSRVGDLVAPLARAGRVAVVTDTHVAALYGDRVTAALDAAGFTSRLFPVPAGEHSKSAAQLAELWDAFVAFDMDRSSTVVALGGGVVGDLAGFAAATYMRGVRYVQVPTTMLACVDSSVGGKTAIDLAAGKNLVGAFHQPSAVVIDPGALRSLPGRELSAGLAEVVKHGMIMDAAFFERLERDVERLRALEGDVTTGVIHRNCELKAGVVAEDEREAGRRAILNYGHSVGHAVEMLAGGALVHGEAVAVGMAVEARVAETLGRIGPEVTQRQNALLGRAGLVTTVGEVATDAVIETMRHDKKARHGKLNLALPSRIGACEVVADVGVEVIARSLEDCRER